MAVAGVDCAEVFGAAVWPRRARDSRRGRYVTRVGYAEVLREPLLARVGYATRAGAVAWPCLGTRLLPGPVRANRAPHSGTADRGIPRAGPGAPRAQDGDSLPGGDGGG